MDKTFQIPAEEIEPLIPHLGACFATDRILVDGAPVGVMYREEPDFESDGGWRFLAGDEDEAYMDAVERHGIYTVNTIANYDRDIIRFLLMPPGTRVERRDGVLQVVDGPEAKPEVELLSAAKPGALDLGHGFELELASPYWRRIEDGCLVIWKDDVTGFFSVREDTGAKLEAKIDRYLADASEQRRDQRRTSAYGASSVCYHLDETDEDGSQSSLNGAMSTPTGFLQCVLYYEDEISAEEAENLWASLMT